ncbi:snurportin-1-like [Cebus imitator]|uniref:snurportin-1-like n=1 Tax=Cebus imitator TaxID=2715852 RepID=UPI000809CB3E|nr:snurportin-1-like [Cebus imitator]XP_037590733.1 snurportin-1-like [Cebus imitator]XP_037590734.1 snurportin-1-like [Cebus imitator]XP_037590735.1 snurportin-1-like [Cebus imitator]
MEELSRALASSFSVSEDLNSTAAPHPRLSQYKSKFSSLEQSEPRQRLLELQKSKRLDYVNHARRLAEDDWTGMESEEEDKKDDEEMDIDTVEKLPKRYANQIQRGNQHGCGGTGKEAWRETVLVLQAAQVFQKAGCRPKLGQGSTLLSYTCV